ncbi:MAG TPA: ATP synthase F0 subunit B, partial [Bdellovibrionales bacterium]|nr:ATP synthase F0 subunit B [Bdellovibrionales bacterium]
MEILKSLGVDGTIWIHLACFLVSYIALTQLILKPYQKALEEREKRTVGNEEAAVQIIEEANELHSRYEQKAREVNAKIKSFYDQSRTAATKEYDRVIEAARAEAGQLLDASRSEITTEVQQAKRTLT